MRVFILNGPPGIGKDTLADNLCALFGFPTAMFKTALYAATAIHFLVDLSWLMAMATTRTTKEVPQVALNGLSPREALIHVSEKVIKPEFGKKFFGLKAVETLQALDGTTGNVVFSDGGFAEETECLVEHGFEVHIIQLHHKDFNFSKDSRDYVSVPGATVHRINVTKGFALDDLNNFCKILEKLTDECN